MENNVENKGNPEERETTVLCAWCGKKKERGKWVEITPEQKTQIEEERVSHGICPDCDKEAREKYNL